MRRWVATTRRTALLLQALRDEPKHVLELDALRRLLPSERQSMAIERG